MHAVSRETPAYGPRPHPALRRGGPSKAESRAPGPFIVWTTGSSRRRPIQRLASRSVRLNADRPARAQASPSEPTADAAWAKSEPADFLQPVTRAAGADITPAGRASRPCNSMKRCLVTASLGTRKPSPHVAAGQREPVTADGDMGSTDLGQWQRIVSSGLGCSVGPRTNSLTPVVTTLQRRK